MTRTLHPCPICGTTTSLTGPCEQCLERRERHTQTHRQPRVTLLDLAWQARATLFQLAFLLTCTLTGLMLYGTGRLLHLLLPVPSGQLTATCVALMLSSTGLLLTQPRWTHWLHRRPHARPFWLAINLLLLILGTLQGLGLIFGGLVFAARQWPALARLTTRPPLWPWAQATLLLWPLLTTALTIGTLRPL